MIRKVINPSFEGMLLKEYLFEQLSLSHNLIKKAKSETGQILINGEKKTVRYRLKAGDNLQVIFPSEQIGNHLVKSDIPLKFLYEDNDIIVINKQAGVATIPSRHHPENTIANGLLHYYDQIGLKSTIHVVTRLDKETSGALLVAKHQYSHSILSRIQKKFLIKRKYIAIVDGNIPREFGTINAPIARKKDSIIEREVSEVGKKAVTHFTVIERFNHMSVVKIELETGRTHQIRVHFSYIGHPLVGDGLYHAKSQCKFPRTALHCSEISFPHPMTKKILTFSAPLHEDMKNYISKNKG